MTYIKKSFTIILFVIINIIFQNNICAHDKELRLIGGETTLENKFLASTVYIRAGCTAAKIDDYLFITAAHCAVSNYDGQLRSMYKNGSYIYISNDKQNLSYKKLTVVETRIHPRYLKVFKKLFPSKNKLKKIAKKAYDVAVVTIYEDTPDIPKVRIDYALVQAGDEVIITGYGCENGVDSAAINYKPKFKYKITKVLERNALEHFGGPIFNSKDVYKYNIITPGISYKKTEASICPGDSGGPLYKLIGNEIFLVGVNAYYSFTPFSDRSKTNWHARLSNISNWLDEL